MHGGSCQYSATQVLPLQWQQWQWQPPFLVAHKTGWNVIGMRLERAAAQAALQPPRYCMKLAAQELGRAVWATAQADCLLLVSHCQAALQSTGKDQSQKASHLQISAWCHRHRASLAVVSTVPNQCRRSPSLCGGYNGSPLKCQAPRIAKLSFQSHRCRPSHTGWAQYALLCQHPSLPRPHGQRNRPRSHAH